MHVKRKKVKQNQSYQQFKIDMISLEKCNINTVFWLFAS